MSCTSASKTPDITREELEDFSISLMGRGLSPAPLQDSKQEETTIHQPTAQVHSVNMPSLLALPRELRDQIFLPLLVLDSDQATLPQQPTVTAINRQIRAETLPDYYRLNVISFQLDSRKWLAIAQAWLSAIGDSNVGYLRRLEFSGWRRIPFGHMCRRVKVIAAVNLKECTIEDSGGEGQLETEDLEDLKLKMRNGKEVGWDVEALNAVMESFWSGCAGSI